MKAKSLNDTTTQNQQFHRMQALQNRKLFLSAPLDANANNFNRKTSPSYRRSYTVISTELRTNEM